MVANLTRPGRDPRASGSRTLSRLLVLGGLALGLAGPLAWADATRAEGTLALAGASASSALDAAGLSGQKLSGLTRDALGEILAGVEILLAPIEGTQAGEPLARVRSDASGRFRFPSLEPGLYRVVAVKGGYGVVVGQVNTMVQASIDLILFPTGREDADPASTPADAAWALRLPSRDSLEDTDFGFASTLSGGTSVSGPAPARPPLHLSLTHQELEGGANPGSTGLDLDLAGALSLGGLGNLNLDVDYARIGRAEGARDDDTLVSLGWIAPGGVGVDTRIDARGSRRERERLAEEPLFSRVDRYSLAAEQLRARPYGSLVYSLRAESFDAEQIDAGAGRAFLSERGSLLSASAELGREWSARHGSRARVEATRGSRMLLPSDDSAVLLAPSTEAWSFAALDRVGGSSVSLFLEDRRALGAALSAVLRSSAHALPGASERGLRSASALGLVWQPLAGTELRAELGADWGGGRAASTGVWRLEVEHADENWNVIVGRASQTGASTWSDDVGLESPLLVTDHDGRMDVWSLETSLSPDGAWWPTLALRGELYTVDGRLAARIDGDMPFVPVASEGRAEGHRVELGVTLARLGTLIEVTWEGIEDRQGRGELLGGASSLTRRGVNLRQRLGMVEWYGTNCYLLVGVVDQNVELPAGPAALDESRLAFFDLRRVSGGLAVAF